MGFVDWDSNYNSEGRPYKLGIVFTMESWLQIHCIWRNGWIGVYLGYWEETISRITIEGTYQMDYQYCLGTHAFK